MKYLIKNNDKNPAYLQLYLLLRDGIINKIYPYKSKLPSKRILAVESGVSTITVEHAYDLLIEEGYVESRERSGYFVLFFLDDGFASNSNDDVNKVVSIKHVSFNTNEKFPFSVFTKTMRKVITIYGEKILDKSPNTGSIELKEAIKCYLARSKGIDVDIEQIIIGSGSEYLYGLITKLFNKSSIYAIEDPSYQQIEHIYQLANIHFEKLKLGNDGIESTALKNTKANILHITPYRSFPSGISASNIKRHEYLLWASKDERYIIEDDFESEFSVSRKPTETLFSNTTCDNILYINSFSKTISPSIRVAYMLLPKHLIKTFNRELGYYSCTVPTYIQYVITNLIVNGDFERHINRVRRKKRKEWMRIH